ncbi:MAG: efflux RND transporter permease subunit [Nitrospirota bacterium]|nr:MAG: efflux RND transporter permease subunit [Nitrospirota bacterium]
MDLIGFSIKKPVTVIVGILLILMFGIIGLKAMPYQLSPSVTVPEITITTIWRGASPYEVERDIIEEQENTLKGITGLTEMESDSFNDRGTITLRFTIDTDVDDALLRVSNKLNEVKRYPEGADKPVINATGSATSPVIWIVMRTEEGNPREVDTYLSFFEDEIRQHLERVEGVADIFVPGGRAEELHIIMDQEKLAAHGLTISDVINVLNVENANISAGVMGVGRRDFRIRTTGEFSSIEDVNALVLMSSGQARTLLSDVADVKKGYSTKVSAVLHNGSGGMAFGIKPEPGTNVLEMTRRVERVVKELNDTKMKDNGIYFHWVYDQRHYIEGAISQIQKNIFIGGILAISVLLIFLRSVRSTIVVATSIPISIIGTFIFMKSFGRSLNVVSLSGIAFAVGMLVDNAIVVIENIDRHRKLGKSAFDSAYKGASEVWGAVLASTLTTIAVFLPVVFLKEESGQLFSDIAIAVVSAVTISLFVSISVIPTFANKLFSLKKGGVSLRANPLTDIGNRIIDRMIALVSLCIRDLRSRAITVGALIGAALLITMIFFPPREYLPQGNRNFVLTILAPPPGLSVQERMEIGENIFKEVKPHLKQEHQGFPAIENMFYVGHDRIMLFGALSSDWERASELVPLFNRLIYTIPGMYGVALQPGIFQTRFARGRTIDVDVSGDNINDIVRAAGMLFVKVRAVYSRVRPVPSVELQYPEIKLVPNRDRLKASGLSAYDLGIALDVIMDGSDIGDFKEQGRKKRDMILMTTQTSINTPEELYSSSIVTPKGQIVPVSSLASMERTFGITEIRHLERTRTITLQVTPPLEVPLETAVNTITNDIVAPLQKGGVFKGVNVRISGAADKLKEASRTLQWNFILAALIAYLLMSALFGNFLYPLIIMFTVPLAGAGGFLGLRIMNLFVLQPLDIVTMLGFVILVGVVVNNAILIVHQALNNVRYNGMDHKEAVIESVRVRLRPIYMSASTSIFGMLPLVVIGGAGSELYRGLGSVIIGGIAISTIFTVFLIPALLMFVIRMETVGVSYGGPDED